MSSLPRQPSKPPKTPAGYVAPSPIERRPSSPRKFSGQSNPEQPQRQPSPSTPSPIDPGLKQLTAQLSQMQEDIRKRDALIQDLYKQFQSPPAQDAVTKELAEARRQIEELKVSTSQLKRGQEELVAMSTPEKAGSVAGASTTLRGVRDRIGKWQEYLETPISVSQRRSRRETPRHSRYRW
jgi:TolA-binding protein